MDEPAANHIKLIDLPIAEARAVKWKAGRAAYGGDSFQGDPLLELHDELLDAMNYTQEATDRGAVLPGFQWMLALLMVNLRREYKRGAAE